MFGPKTYTVHIESERESITIRDVKQIDHVEPAILTLIKTDDMVLVFNFNKIHNYRITKKEE